MNFMAQFYFAARRIYARRDLKLIFQSSDSRALTIQPQGVIKADRILKFNAIFAAYEICNINLKAAILF